MESPNTDRNSNLFRLVVDQAPDAIIFADRDGAIQIWNNAAADLLGYPPEEVIGQNLDLIIPEHLRHAHWEGFRQAMELGRTKHGRQAIKTRAVHKNGRKVYLNIAFSVVKDRGGDVIGAMATAREVVEKP